MSQHEPVLTATRTRSYERKSDMTLWITLAVGFAVIGALGTAHWVAHANKVAAKPVAAQAAHESTAAGSVHRCADGRVSFNPCT